MGMVASLHIQAAFQLGVQRHAGQQADKTDGVGIAQERRDSGDFVYIHFPADTAAVHHHLAGRTGTHVQTTVSGTCAAAHGPAKISAKDSILFRREHIFNKVIHQTLREQVGIQGIGGTVGETQHKTV